MYNAQSPFPSFHESIRSYLKITLIKLGSKIPQINFVYYLKLNPTSHKYLTETFLA